MKTHVRFSKRMSNIRLTVSMSVRLSVNFSHFHLYLQNHWANTFDFRYERVLIRNALSRRRVEKGTNLARYPGQP